MPLCFGFTMPYFYSLKFNELMHRPFGRVLRLLCMHRSLCLSLRCYARVLVRLLRVCVLNLTTISILLLYFFMLVDTKFLKGVFEQIYRPAYLLIFLEPLSSNSLLNSTNASFCNSVYLFKFVPICS